MLEENSVQKESAHNMVHIPSIVTDTGRYVRAIALDVDGVLTDGSFWWGPNGEEYKRFHFSDIMGVSLGSRAGILFSLISGEATPFVDMYAKKMKIEKVYAGTKDKATALLDFSRSTGLDMSTICFVGDDVNDLPAMELAGISVAPANANDQVKSQVDWVTDEFGGNGAVRRVVDTILGLREDGV